MTLTIHHNKKCGTSRNALKMIKESGEDYVIVDYLADGWKRDQLIKLFDAAGITAKEALRKARSPAEELGLLNDGVTEDQILDAMVGHPVLVERPIVISPKGVSLCRPVEKLFDLLENPPETFTKENGDIITRS